MKAKVLLLVLGALCVWSVALGAETKGEVASKGTNEKPNVLWNQAVSLQDTKPMVAGWKVGFQGLSLGMSQEEVLRQLGSPKSYQENGKETVLYYEYGRDIVQAWEKKEKEALQHPKKEKGKTEKKEPKVGTLQIWIEKELPASLKQVSLPKEALRSGVTRVYVTAPFLSLPTCAGVRAGDGVSYLLDHYGVPSAVLRDADTGVYRFVYQDKDTKKTLVFYGKERNIEAVELRYDDQGLYQEAIKGQKDRDFTLMGLSIGDTFMTNRYDTWQRLIEQDDNSFWFYKTYGVWTDKNKVIKRIFLATNEAYSSRGITLGNKAETVLRVYGQPNWIEKGQVGDAPAGEVVDAWYYVKKGEKPVYLIFLINQERSVVEDVILSDSPIANKQNTSNRYGLV